MYTCVRYRARDGTIDSTRLSLRGRGQALTARKPNVPPSVEAGTRQNCQVAHEAGGGKGEGRSRKTRRTAPACPNRDPPPPASNRARLGLGGDKTHQQSEHRHPRARLPEGAGWVRLPVARSRPGTSGRRHVSPVYLDHSPVFRRMHTYGLAVCMPASCNHFRSSSSRPGDASGRRRCPQGVLGPIGRAKSTDVK